MLHRRDSAAKVSPAPGDRYNNPPMGNFSFEFDLFGEGKKDRSLQGQLEAVAMLPGEPRIVSAAGMTRRDEAILTLENPSAFETSRAVRRNDASSYSVMAVSSRSPGCLVM